MESITSAAGDDFLVQKNKRCKEQGGTMTSEEETGGAGRIWDARSPAEDGNSPAPTANLRRQKNGLKKALGQGKKILEKDGKWNLR